MEFALLSPDWTGWIDVFHHMAWVRIFQGHLRTSTQYW